MRKLAALALFATLLVPAIAVEPRPPAVKDNQQPAGPAAGKAYLLDVTGARARSGRVPNGYGQLNLSQAQRERIYGIQAVYSTRIKELEAEIEQLKLEQVEQIKNVLTDPQRAQLERYEESRRKG